MFHRLEVGRSHGSRAWLVAMLALLVGAACSSRPSTPAAETYPAPRYPRYLLHPSPDKMLAAARIAVRQPYGRCPLGLVKQGQTVHVLIQYGQDMDVWEAFRRAWAEMGVEAKAVGYWDIMGQSKDEYYATMRSNVVHGNEAWKELGVFRAVYKQYYPEDVQKAFGNPVTDEYLRRTYVPAYLEKHPEIQHFYAGLGGGNFWKVGALKPHADKFLGNWIYVRPFDLLGKAQEFPGDVWARLEDLIVKPIPQVSEVIFTDPEGTNLHWMITREQNKGWSMHTGSENHLNLYPGIGAGTLQPGAVIRATGNHDGLYPAMAVSLDQYGRIEKIDGGGRFGELFGTLVNHPKMQAARFPSAPESGYWYLTQDGFGTNPKFVRSMDAMTEGDPYLGNLSERNRAGVQHFSFSSPAGGLANNDADIQYAKEAGLPLEHTAHMHVYFPTVRWRLQDSGEWITVSDKGYVKAFDDPEIRALAARYGDPAKIFRYEWIPDMPGVNVAGDLARDYEADPWTYVMAQWAKIQNGTYPYYVEDYPSNSALATDRAGMNP